MMLDTCQGLSPMPLDELMAEELRYALVEWSKARDLMESEGIDKITVRVIRRFKLFDLVEQEWTHPSSPGPIVIDVYVNKGGDHIGTRDDGGLMSQIRKLGILAEKASPDHCVCSIGKGADGKWYGWSHRAMVGFGLGDRVFEEAFGDDSTPFVKHGNKVIATDDDARLAATRFASSVS